MFKTRIQVPGNQFAQHSDVRKRRMAKRSLSHYARKGQHREAAILQLLQLHLFLLRRRRRRKKAQRIKAVITRLSGATVHSVVDGGDAHQHLEKADEEEDLTHPTAVRTQVGVVCRQTRHIRCDIWKLVHCIRKDKTSESKHANATMLDLSFPEPFLRGCG